MIAADSGRVQPIIANFPRKVAGTVALSGEQRKLNLARHPPAAFENLRLTSNRANLWNGCRVSLEHCDFQFSMA